MDIIIFNLEWMVYNIFLAFLPVIFGWIMLRNKYLAVKIIAGALWFIFLPNSLYLLTDVAHFFEDIPQLSPNMIAIDLFLYLVLIVFGILTFTLSLYPFEKLAFSKNKNKMRKNLVILFGFNLLVGFGMVLGRFQRTNSWDIFLNTRRVILDTLHTVTSIELLFMTLIFALICQLVYTTFNDVVLKNVRK
jgi:uncharacterized membrane protein